MSNTVIKVQGLSKRYRIGLKEKRADTFIGQLGQLLRAPFDNFRQLRNLSRFQHDDESVFWALRDVEFEVQQGEVLGIIGHNGAGKSTLLKILSRITEPSSGEVRLRGRVSALLEVGTGFHPELTGRENIFMNGTILGMTRREIDAKLDEIVDFSGVEKYIDTPVKFYSSGMKVRLGFAVAAHLEPEILIIDEVLAVGDLEFQKRCLTKMENVSESGRTILFVSHNMAAVKSLCKKGLVLQHGKIIYAGNTPDAITQYLSTYKKETLNNGLIPNNYSTYSTDEAKFVKFLLLDENQNPTTILNLYEPIRIYVEMESSTKITNGMIDVKIISKDGIEIVHSMNHYDNYEFDIESGKYILSITIENLLQPGIYAFNLGIHHSTGYTIDYIEGISEFEIQMMSNKAQSPLRRELLHGYVQAPAQWNIQA